MKKLLALLLVLCLPVLLVPKNLYAATISYDTSGSNSAAQDASVTLTAAASSEVAVIAVYFGDTKAANTPTVGGSSTGVTQVGTDNDTTNQLMRLYCYYNPPTSATAYAVHETTADAITILVSFYAGGAQSGCPDSTNQTANNGSVSLTLSTTVVATNCWLVGFYLTTGSGNPGVTAGTGTTNRQVIASAALSDSNATVGTGSQSLAWTGQRTTSSGIMISLAPATAVAATANYGVIIFFQ